MSVAKKSNVVTRWEPLTFVGIDMQDRYVRVRCTFETGTIDVKNVMTRILPGSGPKVKFPAGTVGYCYATRPATVFVGFMKDGTPPTRGESPTRCDHCIQFTIEQVRFFDVEAD